MKNRMILVTSKHTFGGFEIEGSPGIVVLPSRKDSNTMFTVLALALKHFVESVSQNHFSLQGDALTYKKDKTVYSRATRVLSSYPSL